MMELLLFHQWCAINKSTKSPKNFIYDTKKMFGRKYHKHKHWTFDTAKGENGEILIKIDNELIEPYKISGMILIELMKIANSHLNDQTNKAIITIPAYFTKEQIEDTKRAIDYVKIELIDLIKEPISASISYGYHLNATPNKKDVLIYDFGGGTLDVSYVEVIGNSFNILATAGDSELGGQDFTNSIFEIISPKIDEICQNSWNKNTQFVTKIRKQCERAKINLSSNNKCSIYFENQNDLLKNNGSNNFDYIITRDEFEKNSKLLFDKCMEPVKDVLLRVGRDPHQINNLILVGRSSHLPYNKQKL